MEKQKEHLEKYRTETLSIIVDSRSEVEDMAQRPRNNDDPVNSELLELVRKRLTEIEDAAKIATNTDALDDLEENAESQEAFRAYLCPREEIWIEGSRVIALLEWWGIPKSETEGLRNLLVSKLDQACTEPDVARSALHALFEERDEWDEYREDYEETMQGFARWLFGATILLPLISVIAIHYAFLYSPLAVGALLLAGGAGSCVSVITKLPALEGSRSEKIDSYERRIWSRISTGTAASLIGCGLLGWGIIPISLQGRTFADVLNSSVVYAPAARASDFALRVLILLAVPMLFGFSERALTSFERGFLGNSKKS